MGTTADDRLSIGRATALLRAGRLVEAEPEFRRAWEAGAAEGAIGLALCLGRRGAAAEAQSLLATLCASEEGVRRVNAFVAEVMPRSELHDYWRDPPDADNAAAGYAATPPGRSVYLTDLVRRFIPRDARLLEIGCNAGRNLAVLHLDGGYANLAAIEISRRALDTFRASFPRTFASTRVECGPAEEVLARLAPASFDLVFSMAVLEHIHPDSEAVFADVARVAACFVLTIEDEEHVTARQFARDYGRVFEGLGLRSVLAEQTPGGLGLGAGFVTRVFAQR
jgi:SAM-dependent methyltransferase